MQRVNQSFTRRLTQDALKQIIEALQGARDFAFSAEDATGLDDTPEKGRIDRLIDWMQQRKETAPEGAWVLHQDWDCYRDYKPRHGDHINGWTRITFNDGSHGAYASLFNPKYRADNSEELSTGETVSLEWNDAVRIVFGAPVGRTTRKASTATSRTGQDKRARRRSNALARLAK